MDWKLGLDSFGLNRIKSDWFFTIFYQTRYKTFFQIGSKWLGTDQNSFNRSEWTIPNQSERRFVSRYMKNSQKSIQINLIQSVASIRINPNWISIWTNLINPSLDWFVLILIENSSSDWFGSMSRIKSDALVRENQLSSCKKTQSRLIFGVRRTKKFFIMN